MKGQKSKRVAPAAAAVLSSSSAEAPAPQTTSRKKSKAMGLEQQTKMLEEENLALRLQLKVGKETLKQDEQKKEDLLTRISDLVENNGSEDELKGLLKSYVVRYSDCSSDHAESVDNHMVQIQRLLGPTKVTKLCLWALNQDEDFFKPVLSPQESLFQIMSEAIEATLDQTEEFKNYRHNAKVLTRGLRYTDRECDDLKQRLKRKNRALAEEMHELQDILTPQQLGKFIVWANKNQDLQEVLKTEWVGWNDPQEEEAQRAQQHRQQRDRLPSNSGGDDDDASDED
jgi:hypothetical protein